MKFVQRTVAQNLVICTLILSCSISTVTLNAQLPDDVYGPVNQFYQVPSVKGTIRYVAVDGKKENSGSDPEKSTTLNAAVAASKSGDAIILRGGTYRTGNLVFNQGITFQAFRDEHPLLKGTLVVTNWEKVEEGLWSTTWTDLFPADPEDWWQRHEEQFTPLHRFNDDMVFVDGRFLQSAGSTKELDSTNFYIDYQKKKIYLAINPAKRLIEVTAFNVALHCVSKDLNGRPSDGIGPVIRGISFSQYSDTTLLIDGKYAEGPTPEAEFGKQIRGAVIENCDISFCSRIAAFLMGDNLTIRNCKISNTSREGIYIVSSSDVLMENNIFTKNNIENITGCYPAAVKIFNQCHRVTVRHNFVTNLPNSNGVWFDVGNVDGVFIHNLVTNVGVSKEAKYPVWRNMSGFFFEISKGAICAGNVFENCDNGTFVLNSSNVKIYNNTYINSKAVFVRNERSAANDHFGWHPATGPDVDKRTGHVFINNLLVQNDTSYKMSLLEVWQPDTLCKTLNTFQLEMLDYNVYVRTILLANLPLISWNSLYNGTCSFSLNSPSELNKQDPQFSANCKFFDDYKLSLFIDNGSERFRLSKDFPGGESGVAPPKYISKLLNSKEGLTIIGAY
jgi:parallel beta-helix repeat protein